MQKSPGARLLGRMVMVPEVITISSEGCEAFFLIVCQNCRGYKSILQKMVPEAGVRVMR